MPLFGTDGIRGVAGVDLTAELAQRAGSAFGQFLKRRGDHASAVVIGKDPRLSSDMLEQALASGLSSVGAQCFTCGILPTPAISYLVQANGLSGGAMISASHNPVRDNGIKFISASGEKFTEAEEGEIERLYEDGMATQTSSSGSPRPLAGARQSYLEFLLGRYPGPSVPANCVVALDCAFGATAQLAVEVFQRIGTRAIAIGDEHDGSRINVNCGATHTNPLAALVRGNRAFCGFAFDGDGDRAMTVDETGAVLDGDNAIASFVKRRYSKRDGISKVAVGTSYSNEGLSEAIAHCGFTLVRARTGDRYVYEDLKRTGAVIGGEPSGHLIFMDLARTGDGILSALLLFALALGEGSPFSALAQDMRHYPQVLLNLALMPAQRSSFGTNLQAQEAIRLAAQLVEGRGRVFVRASGTEPLLRILVEADDRTLAESTAQNLLTSLQSLL
ncbi:MAG: phosphoglucosamine mutase [bacterium]